MWKIIAPMVVIAVLSTTSGLYVKKDNVYLDDYTLLDECNNDVCNTNDDGSKSCSAQPNQKLFFSSTWVLEDVDCKDLWISLIWRDKNRNASTRSWACHDPCYDNNLVIHGECDTRVVLRGKHQLEPFLFTVLDIQGPLILDALIDSDFVNGAKTRDRFVGTMYISCY